MLNLKCKQLERLAGTWQSDEYVLEKREKKAINLTMMAFFLPFHLFYVSHWPTWPFLNPPQKEMDDEKAIMYASELHILCRNMNILLFQK
jgi:hypothetical protein